MPLPTWVRARGQHHCAVFKVVPGQNVSDPKGLQVFDFYGEGRKLSLKAACAPLNGYYNDWEKVQVDDVSALVPASGWKWDDGKRPRSDKLGLAAIIDGLRFSNQNVEGYGALDYGGAGGAVIVGSGCLIESCQFRNNAAAALYIVGQNNVVRGCDFFGNCRDTSDQGQIYLAGRGKGGYLLIEGCNFYADPNASPVLPWDGKTYWRRWGVHLDDGASNVLIRECRFFGLDGALLVNGGTNVTIEGCASFGCSMELEVGGRGNVLLDGSRFDGKATPARTRYSDKPNVVTD